ncbi:uncharacterized protein LOC125492448 [Beta vulgaris subsp. vulgaris]|uniref:uncharacterized protein LOC125492448 n=1 Tax=Beta vulgaris subsp. vulgaris TaxID=3555 RepID=UPI0020371AC2|nr:uncharacterized protein LOC125492448 [Beta vulgaris subsp. vulgaris]
MSYQQKGLIAAIAEVLPEAEIRCCARHVYCNFRDIYGGGQQYRKLFWKIAKSTTENKFKENIQLFRDISDAAANDLLNRNYKKWCRAFYTAQSCCDTIDNNMSEVFNAYILNSRHKPIISMLEDIREGLMDRLHKKRYLIGKKDCLLCPRIQQQLEKAKIGARGWSAFWDGAFCYGVREGATQVKYVVNLLDRTCSCNAWQLNGIPCNHAIAAIWNKVEHPEHYVSEYYKKESYLKAYKYLLEPVNGPQEWIAVDESPILPPPLKKVRNRRAIKRKRQAGEVTAAGKRRRTGAIMRCSVCGEEGHNKRSCKSSLTQSNDYHNNMTASTEQPPKSKQKRKERVAGTLATERAQPPLHTSHNPTPPPMHNRGFGVYTYPNGFQRQASNHEEFLQKQE